MWKDVYTNYRQGYSTSVTDYHRHGFYEINLILSGNVRILLGDRLEEGTENRIVLTRPGTPHYISCKPDRLYSRLYLVFTDTFAAGFLPDWHRLAALFGETGRCLRITSEETEELRGWIEQIGRESSPFRQRLLIYYLLSRISDLSGEEMRDTNRIPPYIAQALAYLESHYSEKFLAADLAGSLHIGRTTLMTEFKKHLGVTIGHYLTECRLEHAVRMLGEGSPLEYTAVRCGFADSSGLIHSFKRRYGTTPRQYAERLQRLAAQDAETPSAGGTKPPS